jgi:hypothetical protein
MNGVLVSSRRETRGEERSLGAQGALIRRNLKWNTIGNRRTSKGS